MMTQPQLLIETFRMIAKSKLFPDTPMRSWVKILLFLHKKGYLYVGFENDKLAVVTCAYRTKETPKKFPKRYPDKEEGNILYIAWMVSSAEDRLLPKKLLSRYLQRNPNINEIVYHDLRDREKLKQFKKKK